VDEDDRLTPEDYAWAMEVAAEIDKHRWVHFDDSRSFEKLQGIIVEELIMLSDGVKRVFEKSTSVLKKH
jgi:hypothetical protein